MRAVEITNLLVSLQVRLRTRRTLPISNRSLRFSMIVSSLTTSRKVQSYSPALAFGSVPAILMARSARETENRAESNGGIAQSRAQAHRGWGWSSVNCVFRGKMNTILSYTCVHIYIY